MAGWRDRAQPAGEASSWRSRAAPAGPEASRIFTGAPERAAEQEKLLAEMGPGGRLLAGIGAGMYNTHLNVSDIMGHLPGLERVDPTWWQQEGEVAKPLSEDLAGGVGGLSGQAAALLPAGAGAGAIATKTLGSVLPQALKAATPLLSLGAEGASQGAIAAGPEQRGEGAALGLQLGVGLGGAGRVLKAAKDAIAAPLRRGLLQVSDAAKYLQGKGVDNLTLGQMAPKSPLAAFEEAGQSSAIGEGIKAQRQAGLEGWQRAILREASPTGELPAGSIADQLQATKEQFGPAYQALSGKRLYPEVALEGGRWRPLRADPAMQGKAAVPGGFDLATRNPNIRATEGVRTSVNDFLDSQLSLAKPGRDGRVSAENLQAMRANIRAEIRNTLRGNAAPEDYAAARMLEDAEQHVTQILEAQAPPEAVAALRGADEKYRAYKVLSDAVRRAGDQPEGLRPTHLSQALRAATEADVYARGGGGELRRLAQAGEEVFGTRIPATGARLLVGNRLTRPAGIGLSYLANSSPRLRALALGTGEAPMSLASPRPYSPGALPRIAALESLVPESLPPLRAPAFVETPEERQRALASLLRGAGHP